MRRICSRTFTKVLAASVFCARSRLYCKFSLAVAIVVAHEHLCVVSPRTDVHAKINTPKFFAVHLIAINKDIARLAFLRIVLGIAWIPLENKFKFTITIDIANSNVIGAISDAACRRAIEIYRQKLVTPYRNGSIGSHFLAIQHSLDGILI